MCGILTFFFNYYYQHTQSPFPVKPDRLLVTMGIHFRLKEGVVTETGLYSALGSDKQGLFPLLLFV